MNGEPASGVKLPSRAMLYASTVVLLEASPPYRKLVEQSTSTPEGKPVGANSPSEVNAPSGAAILNISIPCTSGSAHGSATAKNLPFGVTFIPTGRLCVGKGEPAIGVSAPSAAMLNTVML